MLCGNDITGLHKAIRVGFFQGYLACSEKLRRVYVQSGKECDDSIAFIADQIRDLVATQMLDPHIFQATRQAFDDIIQTPALLQSHKTLTRGSDSLSKAWTLMYSSFDALHTLIQEDKIIFMNERGDKKCFNPQCTHRSSTFTLQDNLKLKTCVQCHSAFYRSRICQKTDYDIHKYFCHCPALEPGRKLLRPASIVNIKFFILNVVSSYLIKNRKDELARFTVANFTWDIHRDFVVRLLMNFWGPVSTEGEILPWRGSELKNVYPTISYDSWRKKAWMNYPHIVKATGTSEVGVEDDVIVHLDITVLHPCKEPRFRIHAMRLLSMLIL
ncbi:hypothetical protein DL96DRAFT_625133 [Flagelloscypha sp. PMI_526]|nr:hypothetical protein DL96DRAFT_625133 [Flagelloscypha sp. PMI_526]